MTTAERINGLLEAGIGLSPEAIAAIVGIDVTDVLAYLADPTVTPPAPGGASMAKITFEAYTVTDNVGADQTQVAQLDMYFDPLTDAGAGQLVFVVNTWGYQLQSDYIDALGNPVQNDLATIPVIQELHGTDMAQATFADRHTGFAGALPAPVFPPSFLVVAHCVAPNI